MDPAKRVTLMALRSVIDPEVGLDIVSMGLIYALDLLPDAVRVRMTLTTRGCPMGEVLTGMAAEALAGVAGDRRVDLQLVWSPPWSPEMIAPEARAALRF
jgi:metal-sulfur cluster biosynthetic enzyme